MIWAGVAPESTKTAGNLGKEDNNGSGVLEASRGDAPHVYEAGRCLECVSVQRSETARVCGFCGHSPIYWLHSLKNLRTGRRLIAGSQCIINYQRVYLEMFNESLRIQVQERMHSIADELNSRAPGAISVISNAPNTDEDDVLDLSGYDYDDEDVDADEGAPEGLGSDEIDWENPGIARSGPDACSLTF